MEQPSLTKESRRVLRDIYRAYMERRRSGAGKSSAARFESPRFGGGNKFDNYDDAEEELCDAGYIKVDITGEFDLTNKAIILMENFTKDTLIKWVEFGTQFIP